jgi:hypothetical protein
MAKLEGRVGRIIMDPDGDSEVKLRWSDGNTSSYTKIIRLERVSVRKTPLIGAILVQKRPFCRDRLGADMGNKLRNNAFSVLQPLGC